MPKTSEKLTASNIGATEIATPVTDNVQAVPHFHSHITEVSRQEPEAPLEVTDEAPEQFPLLASLADDIKGNRVDITNRGPMTTLSDFQQLEQTVARGLETFYKVGIALAKIRDNEYYNPPYKAFQEYLEKRWGYTRQRASQLILAAKETAHLSTTVDENLIPKNERAIRELLTIKDELRVPVLKAAHKLRKGSDITTEEITEAIKQVPGASRPKKPKKAAAKPAIKVKSAIKALTVVEKFLDATDTSKIEAPQKAELEALCKKVTQKVIELKLTA